MCVCAQADPRQKIEDMKELVNPVSGYEALVIADKTDSKEQAEVRVGSWEFIPLQTPLPSHKQCNLFRVH